MTYGINEKRYGNTIRFTGAISPVSQSKTIPINWDNIAKVGKQSKGSVSCSCFALAYCRTILDNKVHNWSEYNQNGANQNNVWAMWSWGKYCSATGKNDNEVYTLAYQNINAGKPFIVYVKGGTNARKVNGGHYVTIVGYQNVTSLNSLSANNFFKNKRIYSKRKKRLRFASFTAPDTRCKAAYFLCVSVCIHYS